MEMISGILSWHTGILSVFFNTGTVPAYRLV